MKPTPQIIAYDPSIPWSTSYQYNSYIG